MTEPFDRRQHRFPESRYFEDLAVGERFYIPSRTVTYANFAAFQTVSGDNHPIHYDIEYCRERGHSGLLAHGFQILCFTAAGASSFALLVGDALIAFTEQSSKFLKPVYPGDTLYPMLEITALTPQRYVESGLDRTGHIRPYDDKVVDETLKKWMEEDGIADIKMVPPVKVAKAIARMGAHPMPR